MCQTFLRKVFRKGATFQRRAGDEVRETVKGKKLKNGKGTGLLEGEKGCKREGVLKNPRGP